MPGETELERMVVRLRGDTGHYQQQLQSARVVTEKYTRDISGGLRNAQSRFVAGQKRMVGSLSRTGLSVSGLIVKLRTLGATLRSVGTRMRSLGRSMSMRVTLPLTLIGGASARAFAAFDKAMIESTSIMKVTGAQTKRMRELALSLSGATKQAPSELAEAYFFLASAGKDAEQSMSLLPQVARFATAGAFDMAKATDLLTDAQSALGLSSKNVARDTENMTRVADVLVRANTLANASVEQFSTALTTKAGAALKVFNKSVEEGVAVLAALADQGVKAELAGNALDRVIRLLGKSQLDNKKALDQYNVRLFDVWGRMRNLGDIIADLEIAFKGMSDELRIAALAAMGFEARVQGVILPLLGTSKAIKRYQKELEAAKGTTDRVAKEQMKAFSNQLKILWNQIVIVGIEIGQVLAPIISKLGEYLKSGIKYWQALSPEMKKVVVLVGILAAAIGPALSTFGILAITAGLGLAVLINPITIIAAGIAAWTNNLIRLVMWASEGTKVGTMLSQVWQGVVGHVGQSLRAIKQALGAGDIKLAMDIFWVSIELSWKEGIKPLRVAWAGFMHFVESAWLSLTSGIQTAWWTAVQKIIDTALVVRQNMTFLMGEVTKAEKIGYGFLSNYAKAMQKNAGTDWAKSQLDANLKLINSMQGIDKEIDDLRQKHAGLVDQAATEDLGRRYLDMVKTAWGWAQSKWGALQDFFGQAVDDAVEGVGVVTIPVKFEPVTATIAGSAQAAIEAYQYRMGLITKRGTDVVAPQRAVGKDTLTQDIGKSIVTHLVELIGIAREQLNKAPKLEGAGLGP